MTLPIQENKYLDWNYFSADRFAAYWQQIDEVMRLPGVTLVGEIGAGAHVTASLLKRLGKQVEILDYDPTLEPDHVVSILDLGTFSRSYDCVLCFEVLEHIPFDLLDQALDGLAHLTRKYCIISVPYAGFTLKATGGVFRKSWRGFTIQYRMPSFWRRHTFDGQHYWEAGKRGYSREHVRQHLRKHFHIRSERLLEANCSQVFFVCEKQVGNF